jgi:hypothetical protein
MARVYIRRGTEGPRHDPYGYQETTFVKTNGTEVEARIGGLGYGRVTVNKTKFFDGTDDEAEEVFERLTGMTTHDAEEAYYRAIAARRRKWTPEERYSAEMAEAYDDALYSYAM